MASDRMHALIVDDDLEHAEALSALLRANGFQYVIASDVASAGPLAHAHGTSLAFVSLSCAGEDGLSLLANGNLGGCEEVVLMHDEDDPPRVQQGIKLGATYFFCKPFDAAFIDALIKDLAAELIAAGDAVEGSNGAALDQFGLLRGSSGPMRRVYRMMRKVAPTDASVLLVGESGTGKELAARTIHMLSARADRSFHAMNCGAIPAELFESELFGHEKGSFSGAVSQHQGFFERASGGTLFLDEITEMPVDLQAKLLRVLELGQFRRVGGEVELLSDVRIITATNRDPERAIADEVLREDLYYRIASFPITLPPLRDRGPDIPGLARYFLHDLNQENGTSVAIRDEAMAAIEAYGWPGNVRELMSVVERAYIMARDEITLSHLPDLDDSGWEQGRDLRVRVGDSIENAERKLILATLEANDGDKRQTAKELGVSLKTLYNRLNRYADPKV